MCGLYGHRNNETYSVISRFGTKKATGSTDDRGELAASALARLGIKEGALRYGLAYDPTTH